MHPFCSFNEEVKNAVLFADCSIFGKQGTGLAGTESSYIVFVPTETLSLRSDVSGKILNATEYLTL